ncbi:phage holin family protein [Tepidicella baoligensis]|uniref:phage holin family protein n=1 Tax=Tepidicella baoligensis TaxID=2707016 RepID=UPI0015DA1A4E|nr:phage holin family protein [Tepidicella baoligensis]
MAQDERTEPPSPPTDSLLAGLKGWLHDGLQLVRVRFELLGVEARDHAIGVVELMAWAVAAAVLLCLGLGFLAVLLTVLWWESHRALALAVFTAVFLTLGAVALLIARARARETRRWFEATTQELARDAQQLRP